MTQIVEAAITFGCFNYILFTIISIIYSYGRLNYEYNYEAGTEIDYKTWNMNRNICVIIAISLNVVIAIYFWINLGHNPYHKQSNYTLFKIKEDPLYHQIIEEKPNSFWKGSSSVSSNVKAKWRNM